MPGEPGSTSMTPRIPIYGLFYRLVLQRIDPERAHALVARAMRLLTLVPGALSLLDRMLGPRDGALRVRAMGLVFRSPLCVAAGVDKDATWHEPLAALGFGAVEVGTVTAQPQEGNPDRPRITRLPRDRALLNALGFPSEGAEVVARRLRRRGGLAARSGGSAPNATVAARGGVPGGAGPAPRGPAVLGVNIGKSRAVAVEDAVGDYRASARALAPHAGYLALNVSSPNTPGLTAMQTVDHLEELITGVREEVAACGRGDDLPLLVKIGPDLADAEIERIADRAVELGLDGIVAVNTTVRTEAASRSAPELASQSHGGGLSGRPLRQRALEVLRLLHARAGGRLTLISAGGVDSGDDAWERILAGASLVQANTALVYGGPLWPHRVNRDLARHLHDSPWSAIDEAVGRRADPAPR